MRSVCATASPSCSSSALDLGDSPTNELTSTSCHRLLRAEMANRTSHVGP
jgi:hypothetical protein